MKIKKNEIRYYLTNYFINHQLEKKSFKIKDKLRSLMGHYIYEMLKFVYHVVPNKINNNKIFNKLEIKQIKNIEKVVMKKN